MNISINSEIDFLKSIIIHTPGPEHYFMTPDHLKEWLPKNNKLTHNPNYLLFDDIINTNIEAKIDDVEYLNLSEELLPKEPWDESTWDNWIALLKDKTSKSGKELFLPIRIALTGKSHGPELNKLILLLGYNEVKRRLLRN